jgi:hypothetical protein
MHLLYSTYRPERSVITFWIRSRWDTRGLNPPNWLWIWQVGASMDQDRELLELVQYADELDQLKTLTLTNE